jgi:hypothetical protein
MINNIEYTEIKKFIQDDIILNKILNQSKISIGGAQPVPNRVVELSNLQTSLNLITIINTLFNFFNIKKTEDSTYNSIIEKIKNSNTTVALVTLAASAVMYTIFFDSSTSDIGQIMFPLLSILAMILGLFSFSKMNIVEIITSAIMDFSNFGTQGKNIYLTTTKFIANFKKFIGDSKTNIKSALAGGSRIIQSGIDLVTNITTQISNFALYIYSIMTKINSNSIMNQTEEKLKSWLFGKTVNVPQIDPRVQEEIRNIINTVQNDFTSYHFDETTGKLVYTGNPVKITTVLSSNENHYIKSVQMITEKDKSIHYFINNQEIDINSSTLIQSKPVHTGLVFAYMAKNFSYLNRTMPSKYVYYYGDDGNIKVHLKKSDGSCGEEVSTVSKAIIEQINGQDDSALKNIKVVCEEMFGVKNGLNNDVCSKHFYSILGKSALGMIENLGLAIKLNNEIANILLSANPGIQYEILKNWSCPFCLSDK